MSFADQVTQFRIKALDHIRDIKRAAVFELFSAVVLETPVREGVLRGSWWPSIDVPSLEDGGRADPSGALSIAEIRAACDQIEMEERIFLTNRQPYAARIEYEGWSGKAPEGMVRVNAARWSQIVLNTARELSRR